MPDDPEPAILIVVLTGVILSARVLHVLPPRLAALIVPDVRLQNHTVRGGTGVLDHAEPTVSVVVLTRAQVTLTGAFRQSLQGPLTAAVGRQVRVDDGRV